MISDSGTKFGMCFIDIDDGKKCEFSWCDKIPQNLVTFELTK